MDSVIRLAKTLENVWKDLNEFCENCMNSFTLHFFLSVQKYLVPIFHVLFIHWKLYIREVTTQTVTAYDAKYFIQNKCLNTNTRELSEKRKL